MPVCVGRPETGQCPNDADDDKVNCQNICALLLCEDCLEYRVPVGRANPADAEVASDTAFEVIELLCYLQQKSKILTGDDLVHLCADFYTLEEVENARVILKNHVTPTRLGKLKGKDVKDVARRTVAMLLKVCLDKSVMLPKFTALNLARLPPVSVEHIDVSALMQEICALRQEVRTFASVRDEMKELRQCMHELTERTERSTMGQSTQSTSHSEIEGHAAPEATIRYEQSTGQLQVEESGSTAAGVLRHAVRSGALAHIGNQRKKNSDSRTIVGKATPSQRSQLKSASNPRKIELFMSRLCPDATESIVCESVSKTLSDHTNDSNLSVSKVNCVKLETKYDTYASFHVSVIVNADQFNSILKCLMDPDMWPLGIIVRRFFNQTNRHG